MNNRYQVQKVVGLNAYCLNWPESAWMGIFYFFVFWPKPPYKLFFWKKKLSSAYFKYNLLYFLFSELFCRMKLNFWGSEIWPVMAWESSQAVVKPKAYILKNFAKWAQLLFRKSQESIISRDRPFVIYGGKTILTVTTVTSVISVELTQNNMFIIKNVCKDRKIWSD